jgi:hypothetical protein
MLCQWLADKRHHSHLLAGARGGMDMRMVQLLLIGKGNLVEHTTALTGVLPDPVYNALRSMALRTHGGPYNRSNCCSDRHRSLRYTAGIK